MILRTRCTHTRSPLKRLGMNRKRGGVEQEEGADA